MTTAFISYLSFRRVPIIYVVSRDVSAICS